MDRDYNRRSTTVSYEDKEVEHVSANDADATVTRKDNHNANPVDTTTNTATATEAAPESILASVSTTAPESSLPPAVSSSEEATAHSNIFANTNNPEPNPLVANISAPAGTESGGSPRRTSSSPQETSLLPSATSSSVTELSASLPNLPTNMSSSSFSSSNSSESISIQVEPEVSKQLELSQVNTSKSNTSTGQAAATATSVSETTSSTTPSTPPTPPTQPNLFQRIKSFSSKAIKKVTWAKTIYVADITVCLTTLYITVHFSGEVLVGLGLLGAKSLLKSSQMNGTTPSTTTESHVDIWDLVYAIVAFILCTLSFIYFIRHGLTQVIWDWTFSCFGVRLDGNEVEVFEEKVNDGNKEVPPKERSSSSISGSTSAAMSSVAEQGTTDSSSVQGIYGVEKHEEEEESVMVIPEMFNFDLEYDEEEGVDGVPKAVVYETVHTTRSPQAPAPTLPSSSTSSTTTSVRPRQPPKFVVSSVGGAPPGSLAQAGFSPEFMDILNEVLAKSKFFLTLNGRKTLNTNELAQLLDQHIKEKEIGLTQMKLAFVNVTNDQQIVCIENISNRIVELDKLKAVRSDLIKRVEAAKQIYVAQQKTSTTVGSQPQPTGPAFMNSTQLRGQMIMGSPGIMSPMGPNDGPVDYINPSMANQANASTFGNDQPKK